MLLLLLLPDVTKFSPIQKLKFKSFFSSLRFENAVVVNLILFCLFFQIFAEILPPNKSLKKWKPKMLSNLFSFAVEVNLGQLENNVGCVRMWG
jgi:hypothetical protein